MYFLFFHIQNLFFRKNIFIIPRFLPELSQFFEIFKNITEMSLGKRSLEPITIDDSDDDAGPPFKKQSIKPSTSSTTTQKNAWAEIFCKVSFN